LLAGCSSDEPPTTLPTVPASAMPSPSGAFRPGIPLEAQPTTPESASAFVRFYFEQVNGAYSTSDAAAVTSLSGPDCNSCRSIVADVERLASAQTSVAGQRFKISFVATAPVLPDGGFVVDFRYSSDPYVEMTAAGEVRRDEPPQIDQDAQARLVRQDDRWSLSGIQLVGSP